VTVDDLAPEERQPAEIWTRVMGYHRPVNAFNPGKQAEHAERKFYEESACQRQFVTTGATIDRSPLPDTGCRTDGTMDIRTTERAYQSWSGILT